MIERKASYSLNTLGSAAREMKIDETAEGKGQWIATPQSSPLSGNVRGVRNRSPEVIEERSHNDSYAHTLDVPGNHYRNCPGFGTISAGAGAV